MHLVIASIKLFFKQFFKTLANLVAFVFALFFLIMMVAIASTGETSKVFGDFSYEYVSGESGSSNKLLMVPIHGVILNERATDPLSDFFETQITYGYEIKDILASAADDEHIKGIYLHIDSPGGTVGGAKAIADGITEYRKKSGKPVYAYISGTAASGGYWAAAAADKVVADTGSSVGSIGVIFGPFKYYDSVISEDGGLFTGGVVTQNGIDTTYITAGRSKDLGNPYRQLTAQELASLQESVDDVYQVFVQAVALGRGIEESKVRDEIGAMIYSEKQALARDMIDGIGTKDEVEKQLVAASGVPQDDYQLIGVVTAGGFWDSMLGVTQQFMQVKTALAGCPLASSVLAYHGNVSSFCHK